MANFNKIELGIHLDVGHDSIGWAVSDKRTEGKDFFKFLGAGVVLFPADDCLANHRRAFRRQRRHIRSLRQRIARLKALLLDRRVLTEMELDSNPTACPWKLAARVLSGGKLLSWLELWTVLRWYAHNRGYDGNVLSSLRSGRQVDPEDIKKNAAARELMQKYGLSTMAETMCRYMDVDPQGGISSSQVRFKELGVSFDRTTVVSEVTRLLTAHLGHLKALDAELIHLLVADPAKESHCLQAVKNLPFRIPARYWGGVLFGQLAPRFDNRLIGTCPVSGEKLPIKATSEFLNYRWVMMLANTCVGATSRRLTVDEMVRMNEAVCQVGGFTKSGYKKLIQEVTGERLHNVDALLTAPDADKSLVRFPGLYALTKKGLNTVLSHADLRRLGHQLFRGKSICGSDLCSLIDPEKKNEFDQLFEPKAQRGKKKAQSRTSLLEERIAAEFPSGRAPYSRTVMRKVVEEVLSGKDPREKGGVLYRDATKADVLPEGRIDGETNNHLIRHRVKILLRLLKDIVHDYAENNPARIGEVAIEMARDLKDLSGKTNKEIVKEMLDKTAQHTSVAKKLAEHLHCDLSKVSAGLIRKARVAEDLDYTCPYTGFKYDLQDVVSKNVDMDHVIPRSQRASDSLDSMVLTYTEVNRMKGNRTGLEFVREFGGQRVNGRENLVVLTEERYRQLVEGLKVGGYSSDDRKRQKRRVEKLLKLTSNEMGMTEGMLTRTSYITALAVKAIRGFFATCGRTPEIVCIPGRVTAALRMQWKLLGVLAKVEPRVLDEHGDLRLKSEIRSITHLHHAVDAVTLGLAAALLPRDGAFWTTMCKRRVTKVEGEQLKALGLFNLSAENEPRLKKLPDEIRQSIEQVLAEQRVVVHQPQERFGLKVEQNVWGVESVEGDVVHVHQQSRDAKTGRIMVKHDQVPVSKAFGLNPVGGTGRLKAIKGVLMTDVNFGVALTNPPQVIRFHKVWQTLGNLSQKGIPPVIRRGGLISVSDGNYKGIWRVASVKDVKDKGVFLDIVKPSAIKPVNKVTFAKINVTLQTLMKNGLKVLQPRYTGVPLCPIMSSTSQQKEVLSL